MKSVPNQLASGESFPIKLRKRGCGNEPRAEYNMRVQWASATRLNEQRMATDDRRTTNCE
eukprot:3448507-Alexandrium_andersonii.AAC.1